ncbi:MAG: hypothetical protein AB4426_08520 [Xenococcaceae cyanobacterium]
MINTIRLRSKQLLLQPGLNNIEIIDSTLYLLFSAHCLIGVIAAVVAQQKGYSLGRWIILGLMGGTVALVFALWMKSKQ